MLDLNSLFLLTRYKTSVQFSLINDCASIANDCVVSSMIVFDIRPTCVSLSHVVHCAWHKTRAVSPTMLCYTHVCKFKLPLGLVAGGFCVMMIFPPCPHALHGREPSCIMRCNVHICSPYEAGHSRGARGQPPDTGAPSEARASHETVRLPRRDTI